MSTPTRPFRLRWLRAAAVLLLLGATLGPLLDGIHTHTGTTAYPAPWRWMMARWVPPLFAGAALILGLARPLFERVSKRPTSVPAPSRVAVALGLFFLAYGISGVWQVGWPLRAAALTALFLVAWRLCDRTALGLGLAVLAAIGGSAVEATLVKVGAFGYLAPDLLGIPAWLPFLYLSASVAVGALGKRMVDGAAGVESEPRAGTGNAMAAPEARTP